MIKAYVGPPCTPGGGPLIFKGGYDACSRKQVKRVLFFQQAMYARTLNRVSKTAKYGKKGMFFPTLKF